MNVDDEGSAAPAYGIPGLYREYYPSEVGGLITFECNKSNKTTVILLLRGLNPNLTLAEAKKLVETETAGTLEDFRKLQYLLRSKNLQDCVQFKLESYGDCK